MGVANDEAVIRSLVDAFVDAWNAGDGEACAQPFAADADFTAITGLKVRGREAIARGHVEILSTMYRGTRIDATVEGIRFLRPDVAVADITMIGRHFPFGLSRTMLLVVATREDGNWSIAVFRNMVAYERPVAGPVERDLMSQTG